MHELIVAAGTTRKPKLQAIASAFSKILPLMQPAPQEFRILPFAVDSGIPAMPITQDALQTGARNRALAARRAAKEQSGQADFYIGLEGGFFSTFNSDSAPAQTFLQSWVFAGRGDTGYWGSSGAIPVPAEIAHRVLAEGKELGDIIDAYSRDIDVRSKGGAFEVFTGGLLDRKGSFELALICALAPFYRAEIYGK